MHEKTDSKSRTYFQGGGERPGALAKPEVNQRVLRPNDLFALAYVHEAKLAPDGRLVAYVVSRTDETADRESFELILEELAIGWGGVGSVADARSAHGAGRTLAKLDRIDSPRWGPDGRHLAFVGSAGGMSRIYVLDVDAEAGDARALTPENLSVRGPLSWSPDGVTIAFTVARMPERGDFRRITSRLFQSEGQGIVEGLAIELHLLDTRTTEVRRLEVGKAHCLQPAFSPCGKRILFMCSSMLSAFSLALNKGMRLCTLDLESGHIEELLDARWAMSAAAWSPCGERIVFAGAHDSDLTVPTLGLWVVDRDGANPQCRTAGAIGNVGLRVHHDMPTWEAVQNNIFVVPEASHAYSTVATHGCAEIWRIALDGDVECRSVLSGERSHLLMDVRTRTSQLLFGTTDLHSPWELYLANLEERETRKLTHLNDSVLSRWPKLNVEHLQFRSADSLPIEAWYLSRADRSGRKPTVMFIHGGPFLATGHAFRYDFHLLAANGYGVLFANFRGSAGYGEPFARSIMNDWGARGFPDHIAAVDCAIERGLADRERIGVWGASHGGFATCWIVTHSDRFRAAVAEASVTNFATLYYLSDAPHLFSYDLGGRPHEIPDVYRSRSPLTYASRCKTPTLMLHGDADIRCPMAEAEQFYRALHDVGCATELVQVPGMNHLGDSVGPLSARRAQNEALLNWFERYL